MRFTITTNCEPLLKIAGDYMEPHQFGVDGLAQVQMRFWVDPRASSRPPWPKPYFRGHDHLIFAGFDTQNSLLFDLRKSLVLGRLSPEFASDATFWKIVVFPVLVAIIGSARGRALLHCAFVAWRGTGVLLAGDSGSGKSTLALALSQIGFAFGSDDRTLFSLQERRLLAHGLGPCMKLRPEAAEHFGRLDGHLLVNWGNEEGAIYLDPITEFGVERVRTCEPRFLFFLERASDSAFSVESIPSQEAASRLEGGLHQESTEASRFQKLVIDSLAERECFSLRHAGSPHGMARALQGFLADRLENGNRLLGRPAHTSACPVRPSVLRQDPLRRFVPLRFSVDFRPMHRNLRVESNSALVMEYSRKAFYRYGPATGSLPDFCWRVISDPDSGMERPWPEMTAFSHCHLRFVNLGQRSFIAVDTECREAIAFVSDDLVGDEAGFVSIVLASLFYLSAGALGFTAISASCVARGGKGLLLFGVPRSGKTTSCFMARGEGYLFHADQACFLEMENGTLQTWGEFWPAAFHLEATRFLPEIAEAGKPLMHRDAGYLCIEKNPSQQDETSWVVPVGCILLERRVSGSPKLIQLSARDFNRMLDQGIPFNDHSLPLPARRAVDDALRKLPAFRLVYGDRPSVPSQFLRSLLSTHELVEWLR